MYPICSHDFSLIYINNFVLWKQTKLGCNVISCKINDGWFFWQQYTGIIESGIGGMTSIFRSITLSM